MVSPSRLQLQMMSSVQGGSDENIEKSRGSSESVCKPDRSQVVCIKYPEDCHFQG